MLFRSGKQYVVTLRVDGLLSGVDWVPGALVQKYPVTVFGQGPDRPDAAGVTTDVVVAWKAASGGITVGDVVSALEIPGVPAAQARVTAVAEQAATSTNVSTGWELVAAMGLLSFVAYVVYRSDYRGT